MKYRTFKEDTEKVSLFGIGTMRLPVIDGDQTKIDEEEAIKMIRYGIDNGVNYVDTAYKYHDGASEVVTGKALKDGYREKVFLADKMPVWLAKDASEQQKIFDEQLERLGVDSIDMYLIHNVDEFIWKRVLEFDTLAFIEKMKAAGKIKYIGFSFHGETPEFFKEVIDYYPWDFCQIQLNYMDKEIQAGVKGLKYAGSKGIPVVIMEPLKGGKLTDILPDYIKEYWNEAPIKRSPAEWALRWVANQPEVMTVLSGVSSMDQLKENIKVLADVEPDSLTDEELDIIDAVGKKYNELIPYSCTNCKYCMPCPQKVSIPDIIEDRNQWSLYNGNPKIKKDYLQFIVPKRRASNCIDCGECESKCPQHLPIASIMKETAEIFEDK